MDQTEVVQQLIFRALKNLNEELPDGGKVPVSADTRLFGAEAAIDSLSLVSVIVDVETGIADHFGRTISLTDDRALSQEVSPFTDVRSLSSYVLMRLAEKE